MSSVSGMCRSASKESCSESVSETGSVAIRKAPGSILSGAKLPLVIEDPERAKKLEALSDLIGKKMASKFKTVRQCFHFIDAEHKGKIVREDIHRLFCNLHLDRNFGHADLSYADDFYELLNLDGNEEIDFHELQAYIGPYIHPGHCPVFVSSSEPQSYANLAQKSKFHPIAQQEKAKDMYTTTYDGFVSSRTTPRPRSDSVPGYGGFVPRWNEDVLSGLAQMDLTQGNDLLPRNTRRKSESDCSEICSNRASTEPTLSWARTGNTPRDATNTPRSKQMTTSGWPSASQGDALRRLNHAALTAGSGFFSQSPSTMPRRGSIH